MSVRYPTALWRREGALVVLLAQYRQFYTVRTKEKNRHTYITNPHLFYYIFSERVLLVHESYKSCFIPLRLIVY